MIENNKKDLDTVSFKNSTERISVSLKSYSPFIWVRTHEEQRAVATIAEIAVEQKMDLYCWSLWQGLVTAEDADKGNRAKGNFDQTWNPATALSKIADFTMKEGTTRGSIVIMRDVHAVLQEPIPRNLRDIYNKLISNKTKIIFMSPGISHGAGGLSEGLPPTLEKQITICDFDLPSFQEINKEIQDLVTRVITQTQEKEKSGAVITKQNKLALTNLSKLTQEDYIESARVLQGLTLLEVRNSVTSSVQFLKTLNSKFLLEAKKQILSKSEILEYWEPNQQMDDVGGLDHLKSYLEDYKYSHTQAAQDFGVEPLRGVLILGVPGCQPAGSKVLMSDGHWKNIEEVKQGDIVMSPQKNGQVIHALVEQTVTYDDRPCYKVQTTGERERISYEASHNHILPFLEVPRTKIDGKTIYGKSALKELTVDEFNNSSSVLKSKARLFTSPAFELPEATLPLDPYAIGVLLGDGGLTHSPALTSADPEIFETLEAVGIKFGITQLKPDDKAITRGIIGDSGKLVKSILGNANAHFKKIPIEYKYSSISQRLELLAGLIDTDGTFEEFTTTSIDLAEDFKWLVHSVGGVARIKERETSYERGPDAKRFKSYRIHYSFVEHFPNQRLERKISGPRDMDWKNPRNRHFETEFTGNKTVYGFSLSGASQWYITDDWIVTHNTGKSLTCKALASSWKLPLIRLDVGKVMGSLVGQSEQRMRGAIKQIEAISPALLWIDEIEKALSGTKSSNQSDGGTMSRVFGTLLTAMEEGLKGITILATANDIDALPPELIRRFSEVFYVDLPGPDERKEIFQIHLRKKKQDIDNFKLKELIEASDQYTGHEISKSINRSFAFAYKSEDKKLLTEHILDALQETKPLSYIMGAKISKMREEARDKYRYASSWAEAQVKKHKSKKSKMDLKDLKMPNMKEKETSVEKEDSSEMALD